MRTRARSWVLCLSLAATAGARAWSQTFADPATAGPDYALQGEYAGKVGDAGLGAQVIALGDGTFRSVMLPGGLPADGWDGKTRPQIEGRVAGDAVAFEPAGGWQASLQDGKLRGRGPDGEFELSRTIRRSPTEGARPPEGGLMLFDGKNADLWENGRITEDGLLMEGTQTKKGYGSVRLHVEFRTPFMPKARGQARGNSGVFLSGRYEVQVLDSFGLTGENNECGGIYSLHKPRVNMCFPPLTWQTYDIDFTAPVFDGQTKTRNARITVRHNGVLIHDDAEVPRTTIGSAEGPMLGPIQCMNHGNPVRFRNIWVVEK